MEDNQKGCMQVQPLAGGHQKFIDAAMEASGGGTSTWVGVVTERLPRVIYFATYL